MCDIYIDLVLMTDEHKSPLKSDQKGTPPPPPHPVFTLFADCDSVVLGQRRSLCERGRGRNEVV